MLGKRVLDPSSASRPASPPLRVVSTATYEDVYRADYARMTGVAYVLTGSNEAAEDVVQDAFVRLFDHFDTVADPSAYLYRSVVNACWSRRRHSRVAERVLHLVGSGNAFADEIDETAYALERLPVRQRTVVVLRFYADLPLAEIACILGITTGTVKSTLHRALASLREVIDP